MKDELQSTAFVNKNSMHKITDFFKKIGRLFELWRPT